MQGKQTPVTIITGFLGSGKTTFLNEVISQNPDTRFAIIENEFGEIGLDQELVIKRDDSIFEMSNGCICCSINNELVENLLKLSSEAYQFDHLIIETTGIAEPLGVAEAFMSDPLIQQKFSVNAIICLADCEQLEDFLKDNEEAGKQLSAADLVLLNKCDLVSEDYVQHVQKVVKEINPYADIFFTSYSKTDTKPILDLMAFEADSLQKKQDAVANDHHHHHHHISSYSFTFDRDFDFHKFYQWATVLLTFQSGRIYRIKGILCFDGDKEKRIFQSVKNRFLLTGGEKWKDDETRCSRIVFIGKELRKDILEKHMRQCLCEEV